MRDEKKNLYISDLCYDSIKLNKIFAFIYISFYFYPFMGANKCSFQISVDNVSLIITTPFSLVKFIGILFLFFSFYKESVSPPTPWAPSNSAAVVFPAQVMLLGLIGTPAHQITSWLGFKI